MYTLYPSTTQINFPIYTRLAVKGDWHNKFPPPPPFIMNLFMYEEIWLSMFNYQVPLTINYWTLASLIPSLLPSFELTSNRSWEKPGNKVISLVSQIYTRSRHGCTTCNNNRPAHHLKLHLVSFPDKAGIQSRSYLLGIGNETDLYGRLHFTHARAGGVIASFCLCG